MKRYSTSENQSFLDVAIQKSGSILAAFDLAVKNGLSVTDDLQPGQELELVDVNNSDLAEYWWRKKTVPATGVIGTWEYPRAFDEEFGEEFA